MKNSFIAATTLILTAIAGSSCSNSSSLMSFGNGYESDPNAKITQRQVNLPTGIKQLETSRGINVTYVAASDNSATISAPSDLQDKISVTTDKDGELSISFTENIRKGANRVTVTVASPAIYKFDASSGSRISLPSGYTVPSGQLSLEASSGAAITAPGVTADAIGIEASSGASVSASVSGVAVACEASSGAAITVSGTASSCDLEASSGAALDASSLKAYSGKADATSGAAIQCKVRTLSISKSSGGSISNEKWND